MHIKKYTLKNAQGIQVEFINYGGIITSIIVPDKEGNLPRLGELFYASHKSMRDDYEVSIPEIDLLVELCSQDKNTFGARLTGGGFGGSIVAITKKSEAARIGQAVVAEYQKRTGEKGTILA